MSTARSILYNVRIVRQSNVGIMIMREANRFAWPTVSLRVTLSFLNCQRRFRVRRQISSESPNSLYIFSVWRTIIVYHEVKHVSLTCSVFTTEYPVRQCRLWMETWNSRSLSREFLYIGLTVNFMFMKVYVTTSGTFFMTEREVWPSRKVIILGLLIIRPSGPPTGRESV